MNMKIKNLDRNIIRGDRVKVVCCDGGCASCDSLESIGDRGIVELEGERNSGFYVDMDEYENTHYYYTRHIERIG